MSNLIDKAEEAQKRKLDFAREQSDRAAVASGNVDENSALYRHAKLNGWDLGEDKELHGPARANAVARDAAATDIVEQRAAGAPRSPISGFGADMDTGRFTRYGNDGTAADSPAQQMYQQLGQLVERGKAERQRKRNLDDAALSYCMVNAKEGNGFVSPDVLKAVSSQLGQEITGGNYTADGNFVLYGPKEVRDPGSGRVVRNGMSPIAVASPEMQMRVLQRSGLGQGLQEQLWDYMTAPGRLTPQQVRDRGFTDPRAAQREAEAKAAAAQSKIDEQKRQFDEKMKLERERLAARQGGGGRYDSRRAQGMKDWLDQNGKTVQDPSSDDPTVRIDNPNFDEKLYNDRLAQYNDYIWQSDLPPAEAINGGEQQAQRPTHEEIQAELARRRAAKAQQQQQSAPLSQPVNSQSPTPAQGQYGLRNDGKTYKGTGWLGELKLPNGDVATEYTMQSDAVRDANGNRIDFPSLVPTLTKDEVDLMVNDIIPNNKPVPDAIAQKAVDFARDRMSKGQSVFAN